MKSLARAMKTDRRWQMSTMRLTTLLIAACWLAALSSHSTAGQGEETRLLTTGTQHSNPVASERIMQLAQTSRKAQQFRAPPLHTLRLPDGSIPTTIVMPHGTSEATCTSTDGKKTCKCGDYACTASATGCGCIKSVPQPSGN